MPSPSDLAREAKEHSTELRRDFELLEQLVTLSDLMGLKDRLLSMENRMAVMEKFEAELRRIAVLEDRINELKKSKEESEKRYWQFVVLFVGGLVTLGINLVVSFIRK
jgi:hypothetical protein